MENPEPLPPISSSYHSVDLSDTIELVATWRDSKAASVKLHTVTYDIQTIQNTFTETSRAIRNIPKNDSDSLALLSKTRELLTIYETHFTQIEELVDKEIKIHHGGIYTFCKLVTISWLLLKESLTIWRDSQQQIISLSNAFTFERVRQSLSRVLNSSLSPSSSLYRTLLPPLSLQPPPPQPSETKPSELNWIQKQVFDRLHDIEQLLPILPLMVTLLQEKKKTNSDHLQLIGVDETDKIPVVLPFWYKYNKNLHGFSKLLHTTFVTVGESHKISSGIKKYAVATVTAIKCTFDPLTASHKAREITHSAVNINLLTSIWNLPDTPWIQNFTNLQLPRVAVSHLIEIPAPNEGYLKGPIQARIISSKPLAFNVDHVKINSSSGLSSLTRVLSTSSFSKLLSNFFMDGYSTPSLPLVLHFHGGGFVSGSSAMHEGYLREWANQTGITILSVDYRLAPQYKFPTALEECYYVYKWLMTTCKLGMKVKKIALVGDSAGGNLVSGVVIKALEEGLPVPDGVIMQYPALDMCATLNASRLLYKNDILVPLSVMKLCRKAYLPDKPISATSESVAESDEAGTDYDSYEVDPELAMNPLVSPIHVSDAILAKFPPVYLAAGDFDPLLDECITYGKRLKHLGKLKQFKIYEGMIHGFLSIADKQVPEAAVAIKDSANWLTEILL